MNGRRDDLAQHLARWVSAYGADLAIPRGTVQPRVASAVALGATPVAETPVAEQDVTEHAITEHAITEQTVAEETVTGRPVAAPTTRPAQPAAPAPSADVGDARARALQELRAEVLPCTRCKLHQGRLHTVFGEGDPFARVMFVGEAPGAREDESGRPFVGPAGQLLDRILHGAMGLQRDQVFIANINKCRPPGNRAPEPDEVAACLPYLRRQVELIRPEVIVCLGRTAAQNLLGSTESTRALRGKVHDYAGTPVIVTWHPAYLLREPARKRETWDDIKQVNRLLGLPDVPGPG